MILFRRASGPELGLHPCSADLLPRYRVPEVIGRTAPNIAPSENIGLGQAQRTPCDAAAFLSRLSISAGPATARGATDVARSRGAAVPLSHRSR